MDAKQEARAIELRAFAEKVVKERGTSIDTSIPNRMVLLFDDRDLQIVYREPLEINDNNPKLNDFARKVGTPVIEHYAVDIFLVPPGRKLTETKVLTVFWKRGPTSVEVETYVPGSWEKRLEALAADMKMRVVQ
jgi:hypothetical protein